MLALTLFVGAGGAILSAVGQSTATLRAGRDRTHAVDLARSAMAEIEAGIKTAEVLAGPVPVWQEEGSDAFGAGSAGESGWELRIETTPSSFDGLTLVTVTAHKTGVDETDQGRGSFTLRQLVRLSASTQEGVGDEDDVTKAAERAAPARRGSGNR